jgi:hypothetical protein
MMPDRSKSKSCSNYKDTVPGRLAFRILRVTSGCEATRYKYGEMK